MPLRKLKILPAVCSVILSCAVLRICSVNADALSPCTPFPIAWQQRDDAGAENQRLSYIPELENWCYYPWNRGTETNNTVGLAGCSLFSVINNVYYHTGNVPDPRVLADFAIREGYRTAGVSGVKAEFFYGFVTEFGAQYGMQYAGSTRSAEEVLAHVRNGGSSSSNVYGHWINIADYDEENDLYLILDSCHTCPRGNNITWTDKENGVAWLTPGELLEKGKSGYYGIDERYSVLYTFDYTFTALQSDANADGVVDTKDAQAVLVNYAFASAGIQPPSFHAHPKQNELCEIAADANGDGAVNTEDAEYILDIYAKTAAVSDNEEETPDNTTEEAE